jgi:hypothetical protein
VSLNDLYQFDLVTQQWSQISKDIDGTAPSYRNSFGFAAVGRSLYIFGGTGDTQSGNP